MGMYSDMMGPGVSGYESGEVQVEYGAVSRSAGRGGSGAASWGGEAPLRTGCWLCDCEQSDRGGDGMPDHELGSRVVFGGSASNALMPKGGSVRDTSVGTAYGCRGGRLASGMRRHWGPQTPGADMSITRLMLIMTAGSVEEVQQR